MTGMWFGLAAIALAGAAVLLYIDHVQRRQLGRIRELWAKAHGYDYTSSDDELPGTWQRATLAKQDYLPAIDIVHGVRRGERFVMFDLEENATIVAVRRETGSDVDLDLRLKSMAPPRDEDLELLGAIGSRAVFATDLEIARRAVDQRMIKFAESLPEWLQVLWTEGVWTLGSMPVTTASRDWDVAVEAVTRLSGMLHVLPPVTEPDHLEPTGHDPGRPFPAFDPIDPHADTQAFTSTPVGPGPVSNPDRPAHPEQGPPPRP